MVLYSVEVLSISSSSLRLLLRPSKERQICNTVFPIKRSCDLQAIVHLESSRALEDLDVASTPLSSPLLGSAQRTLRACLNGLTAPVALIAIGALLDVAVIHFAVTKIAVRALLDSFNVAAVIVAVWPLFDNIILVVVTIAVGCLFFIVI